MSVVIIFILVMAGGFSFFIFSDDFTEFGYGCLVVFSGLMIWFMLAFVNIKTSVHYAEIVEVKTEGVTLQGYIPYIGNDIDDMCFKELHGIYDKIKKRVEIKNYDGWTYGIYFMDMTDDAKIIDVEK